MPCCCKTCRANKVFLHSDFECERHGIIGYIIGKKQAVLNIATRNPEPHRYIYRNEEVIDLDNERAVALYSLWDTQYE